MSESIYLIYKHTSPSGKSYIGLTKDIVTRTRVHKIPSSGCVAFAAAIKKYGWKSFTTEILANNLTLNEANTLESQYIVEHNTLSPHGYNLCAGGNVRIPSDETRAKLVANNAKRGKPTPPEIRAKISASRMGTKQTAEHIGNAANARRGKACSQQRRDAISASKQNISLETRAKLSESSTGRIMSAKTIQKRQATRKRNRQLKLNGVSQRVLECACD